MLSRQKQAARAFIKTVIRPFDEQQAVSVDKHRIPLARRSRWRVVRVLQRIRNTSLRVQRPGNLEGFPDHKTKPPFRHLFFSYVALVRPVAAPCQHLTQNRLSRNLSPTLSRRRRDKCDTCLPVKQHSRLADAQSWFSALAFVFLSPFPRFGPTTV